MFANEIQVSTRAVTRCLYCVACANNFDFSRPIWSQSFLDIWPVLSEDSNKEYERDREQLRSCRNGHRECRWNLVVARDAYVVKWKKSKCGLGLESNSSHEFSKRKTKPSLQLYGEVKQTIELLLAQLHLRRHVAHLHAGLSSFLLSLVIKSPP